MIEFEVPGVPVGNARPRVTRFGTYTPEKTRKYKELIRKTYEKEVGQFIEGFVGMDIMAYFPIPKSYTKKQRREIEEHHFWYGKKPDKDNIDKSVMDALNGIAYKDDSMVVMGRTLKKYCRDDQEPKIIVTLRDMEEKTYEQWGIEA